MKKSLLVILVIILSLNCYSQITFEKGYYINNSDKRVDCLIKNVDWKNNPTKFEFKLTDNSESKILTIKSVKEFEIFKISKYVRSTVNIDRSSAAINELDKVKNPIFKEEKLFLKVLVEGSGSLFSYVDQNLKKFFYKTSDIIVKQLIFKKYLTPTNDVTYNNSFRQQLWKNLKCQNISVRDVERINYRRKELVKFFIKYNQCQGYDYKSFENLESKTDLFNLSIRAGLNSSSLEIQNINSAERSTSFGSKTGLRIGIEFEYVLPYNKNKWSLILEPTYQQFISEKEILGISTPTASFDDKITVDYTSIEVPIGIRHYMFLDNNSKLFINAAIIFDFASNSKFDFERLPDLDINSNNNLVIGFGYKHSNKYSLEFRYAGSRNILSNQSAWNSDYKNIAVIFGYTLF